MWPYGETTRYCLRIISEKRKMHNSTTINRFPIFVFKCTEKKVFDGSYRNLKCWNTSTSICGTEIFGSVEHFTRKSNNSSCHHWWSESGQLCRNVELPAAAGVSDRGHKIVSSEVFLKIFPLSSEYFLYNLLLGRWKIIVHLCFFFAAFISESGPNTLTSAKRFPPFLSTSGETYRPNFSISEAFIDLTH